MVSISFGFQLAQQAQRTSFVHRHSLVQTPKLVCQDRWYYRRTQYDCLVEHSSTMNTYIMAVPAVSSMIILAVAWPALMHPF